MELDFRKILLCHLQHIIGVGKKYISAIFVFCHELMFAVLEGIEGFFIVTLNPASFVEMYRFPAARRAILMKKAILNYLKLQLSDSAYQFAIIELVDKQLCHTFVHKLLNAFVELLGLHGVSVLNVFEHLW